MYIGTPDDGQGKQSSIHARQPTGNRTPRMYFGHPDSAPHTPEEQQAALTARDRQSDAQRQKAPLEPDRYQPKAGYSRLGRDAPIDPSGSYIVTDNYVDVTQASRRQGTYIVGLQGYGKSGLLENLVIQDIKQHIGVCVLDPKGDLIDHVIARIPHKDKEQKVVLLDLKSHDNFIGLNLLDCTDPTDDDAIMDTLSQVVHVFEKAFGVSQDATPRIYDYLFNSAYTLIANPGHTLIDIPLVFNDAYRQILLRNVPSAEVSKFGMTIRSSQNAISPERHGKCCDGSMT